jgi:hypothetical protein
MEIAARFLISTNFDFLKQQYHKSPTQFVCLYVGNRQIHNSEAATNVFALAHQKANIGTKLLQGRKEIAACF